MVGSLEGGERNATSALVPPDPSRRVLLISVYLGVGGLAVFTALVLLERVPPKPPPRAEGDRGAGCLQGMASTFRLMKRRRLVLLILVNVLIGPLRRAPF